jgi:hypothetical protein
MALPKKKGIRKINVGSVQYYYTIEHDYYLSGLITKIGKVEFPNERFLFLVNSKDFWLEYPNVTPEEVFIITPKMVRQAIIFANTNKIWNPNGLCKYQLEENEFKLIKE